MLAYKNEETKYAKDITSAIKYVSEFGDKMHRGSIQNQKLYYTYPDITHSDESHGKLPNEQRQTWQYLKGAKKLPRKAANGHEYIFSEGVIPMIDTFDKPARTMLTSEGFFSRITYIVKNKATGGIRLLTAEKTERIQGFPTGHTQFCMVGDEVVEMPTNKRRLMMGNELVVNLIKQMGPALDSIITYEEDV